MITAKASTMKRARKACELHMDAAAMPDAIQALDDALEKRLKEIATDKVKAASTIHPHNLQKLRDERDQHGPVHTLLQSFKPAFYKVARQHPHCLAVQNEVCDYIGQRGMWLDGSLLKKCKTLSLEALFEEAAALLEKPHFKTVMVDLLSHVVDSADAERLWCLFQAADPKGRINKIVVH